MKKILIVAVVSIIGYLGYKGYNLYKFLTKDSLHYSQEQLISVAEHPGKFAYTGFFPYVADSVGQLSFALGDTVTIHGIFYKGGPVSGNCYYLLISGKDSVWAKKDNFLSFYKYGLSKQQSQFKVHQLEDDIIWIRANAYAKRYINRNDVLEKDKILNDTLLSGYHDHAMGGGNFYIKRKFMGDSTQYLVYMSHQKGGTHIEEEKICSYFLVSGQLEEKY